MARSGKPPTQPAEGPPGSWRPARQLALNAIAPVERFLSIEAASGLLLLLMAAVALVWANSPWHESYHAIWETPIALELGPWSVRKDLHFVINDGLMTIFFFVVGLEIRREIFCGELSDVRRATLPFAAAVGGMVVPALIFTALNWGSPTARGWGIPMATDIAFAVGVLALLGKRVPAAVRVMLLALAVIDDIGAIVVIAIFYSNGVAISGFVVAGVGLALIAVFQLLGVRNSWAYVPPAIVAWAGAYAGGIHPTIAGVIVGLMTPARTWFGAERFAVEAETQIARMRRKSATGSQEIVGELDTIDVARREALSPVERVQHALHGWVAFGIMPLFALANAGVPLGTASLDGEALTVFFGVAAGLMLGKPIGITLASWVCVKLRLAALPIGVSWAMVTLVGVVGGIGFTMAIFIAQLAFPAGADLETGKLAVMIASGCTAVVALVAGRLLLPATCSPEAAATAAEAEASTEK